MRLFQLHSRTDRRVCGDYPTLPAPRDGMFADVISGMDYIGHRVRVVDGAWIDHDGRGSPVSDTYLGNW